MALPTSGPANEPVFWVGQDGNIWVKNAASGWSPRVDAVATPGNVSLLNNSGVWTQIADPAGSGQTDTPAPTNPNGTTGPVAPVFNQAGADNTQKTINEIPALLKAALATENTRYGNAVNQFRDEEAGQRKTYDTSTTTNQQNYDENFMDSIRAGIHGLGGVLSLLRGTGAAGGTAEDLARDTVGGVTANDIRGGADTQKENQTELDSSLSSFLTDLSRKRKANEDTLVNNQRAVRRDSNTQLQDLFGKMAGFYGDVGNTGAANDWMNRAGSLTHDIAADSQTKLSPYDTSPVVVHAPNLTAFQAPAQPNVVAPPSDGQVGSGIFTMTDPRRRREADPAPVGV